MVPPTRRSFLHGAAGLATVLAGCGGLLDGSTQSSQTASDGRAGPGADSATDPETVLIRVDTDRPPVWLADGDRGRPTAHDRFRESEVVDGSLADSVRIAEAVDRESVESFLTETDFETETIYLETVQVEECFQLALCQISWSPNEISTDYSRRSRSYTEQCEVDNLVFEARLIRIPDAIEADKVNGFSSSVGTGSCDDRRARPVGESASSGGSNGGNGAGTATEATESGGDQ